MTHEYTSQLFNQKVQDEGGRDENCRFSCGESVASCGKGELEVWDFAVVGARTNMKRKDWGETNVLRV